MTTATFAAEPASATLIPTPRPSGVVAHSPSLGDLAARLAAVYARLRNLQPGGWNDFHKFSFVSLGQVTDPVREAMADAGVVVLPSVVDSTTEEWPTRNGIAAMVTITIDFTWIAAESGEWMTTRWRGMALDSSDKAFNKAYSAVLKQALQKTFLISSADAAEEDPDAESPERNTPQNPRWDRFELEADIEALLQQAEFDGDTIERFRNYLLGVYRVNAWSEVSAPRLVQVRDRLRELPVEERRETIMSKVAGFADADAA